jgi:2-C-methyl-D-erythritol 4-phosphate cytidylyltransferase / 2-C-methyl-D-erythritol 2,4-cyclodiphosphate synthase
MSLFLIILAAGESKRLKSNTPKPYQIVNNKSLLEYSLNAFKDFKNIKKTIIVYNKKHKKYLKKINLAKTVLIRGGKSRQESTFKALKAIKKMNCKKVLIHDSARPNPSKKIIKNIISLLKKKHAVIPVIKVADATKRANKNIIFKNIERNSLRFAQTPQGFTFEKIYHKHFKNDNKSCDDDASMFTNDSETVTVVEGSKNNLKITNKEDLNIFKSLKIKKTYVGIGFDVHRLVVKRKLYLGGLQIKSKLGTLGHSDGDPVIHAIIDAILGACKMGDIGQMFSNKNKKFKNIRSTLLLKEIIKLIKVNNFSINNLDINIITESPKIQKYKNRMISNISNLCKITKNQINIKGKTTEKLGIIGKEKAIACEVIVSVTQYD